MQQIPKPERCQTIIAIQKYNANAGLKNKKNRSGKERFEGE